MTTDKKPTPARQAPKPDKPHEVRVLWGQPDEPKPKEILIKWPGNQPEGKQNAHKHA